MSQLEKHPAYPAEKDHGPAVVCVTGVTGFVCGPIVARLLELGHTVHGTCRAPEKADTVAHLTSLPGAAERLKLFKADLTGPEGSFDEAMQGCDYVIHTASPYIVNIKPGEAKARLLDPAVHGTASVLGSVNRTPSVKRVVLTSSCAAIYGNPSERGQGHVYTEEDWNPTASETTLPYYYSKKLAEEKAWEMATAQDRWTLVVINPAAIMGPPLSSRSDGESLGMITKILTGKAYPLCPHMGVGMVDIRDVAAAHSLAMVHPGAQGRYICVCRSIWFAEIARVIKEAYPDSHLKPPVGSAPKWLLWAVGPAIGLPRDMVTNLVGQCPHFNNSKIQAELGFSFSPIEKAISDAVEAMLRLGIAKPF
ncbi:hypothetical protein HYH03_000609 [Edaphochlamys debaryana]|uniref:NAD-dependent epimerase/dehydratase domain-containing protein n=1 Tax=Edaphochlamys debaryana TaxID=47281 RepID=A0A835YHT0_9CHLO|nr:hypothetical protein HYH03_000609 [Edaphochlamys debaryana]|eukprot:KAG2502117.1 hypothetical protein HYH03_000609 [Edaphochlamys debaryana]